MTIEASPIEIRCALWHLKRCAERGVDDATKRFIEKMKKAEKEIEPLLSTQSLVMADCIEERVGAIGNDAR